MCVQVKYQSQVFPLCGSSVYEHVSRTGEVTFAKDPGVCELVSLIVLYCRSLCRTIFEWSGGGAFVVYIIATLQLIIGGGVLVLILLLDCCSIIRHAHERTLTKDQNIDIVDTYTCIRAHVIII